MTNHIVKREVLSEKHLATSFDKGMILATAIKLATLAILDAVDFEIKGLNDKLTIEVVKKSVTDDTHYMIEVKITDD